MDALTGDMSGWAKVPYETRLYAVREFLKREYPKEFPTYEPLVIPMVEWQIGLEIEELTKAGKTMWPVVAVGLVASVKLGHLVRDKGARVVLDEFMAARLAWNARSKAGWMDRLPASFRTTLLLLILGLVGVLLYMGIPYGLLHLVAWLGKERGIEWAAERYFAWPLGILIVGSVAVCVSIDLYRVVRKLIGKRRGVPSL